MRRAVVQRFDAGGETVFAAYARHLGTRPNNSLARALQIGRVSGTCVR
ncbi:hypothetical protein ACIHFC_33285 [Streptomyces sp. NPDC052013]